MRERSQRVGSEKRKEESGRKVGREEKKKTKEMRSSRVKKKKKERRSKEEMTINYDISQKAQREVSGFRRKKKIVFMLDI